MTRLARFLVAPILVAVIVAGSGACSVVTPEALRVGSWSLPDSEFLETMSKVSQSPALLGQLGVTGADATAARTGVSYPTAMTAQVLTLYAQSRLFVDVVAQRGLTVTDQQRAEGRQALARVVGGSTSASSASGAASSGSLDALGPLESLLVEGYAAQTALGDSLVSPDEVTAKARAAYDANKDQLVQACASIILIAPPGTETATTAPSAADVQAQRSRADAVKARLDGGADFAAEAKAESAETQSRDQGGSIGCRSRSQAASLPEEFTNALFEAPVGTVSGPLAAPEGWYLVKVTSRDAPPFDQVRAQIESQVRQTDGQQAIARVFTEAAAAIVVVVDPRYGTWDSAQQAVAPPAGALPAPRSPLAPGAAGVGAGGGSSVTIGPDGQPQIVGPDGQPVDPNSARVASGTSSTTGTPATTAAPSGSSTTVAASGSAPGSSTTVAATGSAPGSSTTVTSR